MPVGVGVHQQDDLVVAQPLEVEALGQTAAEVRKVRPPEPYKGKGLRYQGE